MGPDPKKNNISAAMSVVTLASSIALKACSKPVLIALIFAIRFVLNFFQKGLKRYLVVFAILFFGLIIINQFLL